jgi:hypothetical protein
VDTLRSDFLARVAGITWSPMIADDGASPSPEASEPAS